MKKRILIVMNNLDCGGIQKALIEFLNVLTDSYDVTLRCFSYNGVLVKDVPSSVKVLQTNYRLNILAESMSTLKSKSFHQYIQKGFWSLFARVFGGSVSHRLFFLGLHEKEDYDIAISYTQDVSGKSFSVGCNDYVTMCVTAKKKYTFIHCDFAQYGGNDKVNRKRYRNFHKVLCVSESCKHVFDECCPECRGKSSVVRNSINDKYILKLAEDNSYEYDSNYINFITVARLSCEKGIIRTLKVFEDLVLAQYDIRWYIVGDGPDLAEIQEYIREHNLDNNVFLFGQKENPYRYIKNADCLLVPSFHECAPVVFAEASVLHVPVLTTKTLSAVELVEQRKIGWVCENSTEGLKQGICDFVDNSEKPDKRQINWKLANDDTLASFTRVVEEDR